MHYVPAELHVRLYVAGDTLRSRNLLANIKEACALVAMSKCRVEAIDVRKDPRRAVEDQIFAIPTIITVSPYSDAVI